MSTQFNPRYLVITSDEHSPPSMDRGAWASRPEIRGDFERAADEVDTWCAEHYQEGIVRVSTADTLDSFEPRPDRLAWLSDYFDRHMQHCQAYFYIQGQHDRVVQCPDNPWLSVVVKSPKMVYAHQKTVQISNMTAVFHDNTSPNQLMSFVHSLEGKSETPYTLFCHQLWHPWLPANRSAASLTAMPPYITWVISGDYHIQKDEILQTQYNHSLRAWSVGPLHIQDISEPSACRFLVYDFQTGVMTSVPVSCRPVIRFEVYNEDQLAQFEQAVSKMRVFHDETDVDKPIIRLRYATQLAKAVSVANTVCALRAHLFYDPVVSVASPTHATMYCRSSKEDVFAALANRAEAAPGTTVRAVVDAAMDATSPADLESRLEVLRQSIVQGAPHAN